MKAFPAEMRWMRFPRRQFQGVSATEVVQYSDRLIRTLLTGMPSTTDEFVMRVTNLAVMFSRSAHFPSVPWADPSAVTNVLASSSPAGTARWMRVASHGGEYVNRRGSLLRSCRNNMKNLIRVISTPRQFGDSA